MTELLQMQANAMNKAIGTMDGYNCPICRNKGIVYRVRDNEVVSSLCKCSEIRKSIRIIQKSGLDEFMQSKTFDNYEVVEEYQRQIKIKAQSFIEQDQVKWFFIGGQVGCGKTHICTAICSHFLQKGNPVRYMLWTEASKQLKALINDERYSEVLSQYKDIDVLYIDDFFKVKSGTMPTNADVNIAFEILNARLFSKNKITIISSEFTINELLNIDEGTISRISERADPYILTIGKDINKNYRLKAR